MKEARATCGSVLLCTMEGVVENLLPADTINCTSVVRGGYCLEPLSFYGMTTLSCRKHGILDAETVPHLVANITDGSECPKPKQENLSEVLYTPRTPLKQAHV